MRKFAMLLFLPLLAGCSDSDWNNLLSFGGDDNRSAASAPAQATAQAAPAPAAAATAAAPSPFCLAVARQDATTQDFDTNTQQKVAVRSFQQCEQIFGNVN